MRLIKSGCVVFFLSLTFCSSSPTTTDGGTDGGPIVDAKADKATPETGGGDSGDSGTCASGLTCEICDGGFSPTQMVAPYSHANVCPMADVTAFVTACGTTGNSTTCMAWQTSENTSNAACLSCAFSQTTDPKWGFLVCDSMGNCNNNVGGCVDVASGTVTSEKQAGGSGSCGDLITADFGCENYSCGGCSSDADFMTCETSADAHECSTYSQAFNNATGACGFLNDASTLETDCFDQGQTDTLTTAVVTAMCGM
jgi:hypothetical protein